MRITEHELRALITEALPDSLDEKAVRGQGKNKRTLYHINRFRPARPQPKMSYLQEWDPEAIDPDTDERTGDYVDIPDTDNWKRWWIKSPVKSGVFLTPNPIDIAINHGRSGHVYAYKVPEWVIEKSGGLHRYDSGSEVLIPEDVWNDPAAEIEFLGKSMDKEELWDKMMPTLHGRGQNRPATKPSWMSDEELEKWTTGQNKFNLSGLRATKHPKDVIKLLKSDEVKAALNAFEEEYPEALTGKKYEVEWEKVPGQRKGVPKNSLIGERPISKRDQELIDLLKKQLDESVLRACIREFVEVPAEEELHPSQMKTVGEILDLIERIQEETNDTDRRARGANVGIEFIKIAMGEIPLVGGALGAADGLFAMYQAGKNEEHAWAELEEYPILSRMKMHPDMAKHLDPITLREVDKAYQEYLRTLGRETKVSDIMDIDDFTSDWIKNDTGGSVSVELIREFVRDLLNEDPMGFVHDLAAASEDFGQEGEMFFGGDPGKGGGKAIKRAFNANADHQFLSTLDTVHWTESAHSLEYLIGKSKDELSATMNLPGEKLKNPPGMQIGLWVKGRITLAANDHDQLFTGKWHDYMGSHAGYTDEEQEQRQRSSGINKLPHVAKDYSRYGQLQRGNEYGEKLARNIPYVLDQSTWEPYDVNEALVDNWNPVGIVMGKWVQTIKLNVDGLEDERFKDQTGVNAPGIIGKIFELAVEFGIPIFDRDRNELWSPE